MSRGQLYSAAQIRYCLAESLRIEAVREVLDKSDPGSVEEFNAKIADFNGRCSSYRFYESQMFFVKGEIDAHRTRLQADARNEYLQRVAARKAERTKRQAAPPADVADVTPSKPPPQPVPAVSAPSEPLPEPTHPTAPAAPQPVAPSARSAPPAAPPQPTGELARSAPAAQAPSAAPQPPASTPPAPPRSPAAAPAQPPAGKAPPPAVAAPPDTALPVEAPAPAETAVPEQPEPLPVTPAPQAPAERPKAVPPAEDAVMTRYVREIQKVGTRVLDDRQYPEAARAKGWSGTAQIEVRFSDGGFIRSIVLAQSSGRGEFDTHALTIARGIMFPHVPKELAARDFTARFPITFKPRKPR